MQGGKNVWIALIGIQIYMASKVLWDIWNEDGGQFLGEPFFNNYL